jgi:hypothetical protein
VTHGAPPRTAPLSAGQDWIFYREHIESFQDMLTFSVSLPDGASQADVRAALGRTAAAHEALRTRIEGQGRRRTLVIEPPDRAVDLLDLRTCQAPDPAPGALPRWHEELMSGPVDLAAGAARCLLASTPSERRLVIRIHHAMCDGLAIDVLLRDLLSALCGLPVPAAPRQLSDPGLDRDHDLERRNTARWLDSLAGAPASVTFTARRMVWQPDHGERIAEFRLNRRVTARLRRVADTSRVTFAALWLALVHAWTSQYAREHDLVMSMMSAGRRHRDDYGIVANVAQPLWLRVTGHPDDTIGRRIAAVHDALMQRLPWTPYDSVGFWEALCDSVRRRGGVWRPALNTNLHFFGGPNLPQPLHEESHAICSGALAGPVRTISTASLPGSSWADLRAESVVRGGELACWLFAGQAVWSRRAPAELAGDLVRLATLAAAGDLDAPVEAAGVPALQPEGLVRDWRTGTRVDPALIAAALRSLPGVTSAAVHAADGRLTAEVTARRGTTAPQLEEGLAALMGDYRGVAIPETLHVTERP